MDDDVYFFDENKSTMSKGTFITSNYQFQEQMASFQIQDKIDSKYMIIHLLQTEVSVELFCKQNSIAYISKLR